MASGTVYASIPLTSVTAGLPLSLQTRLVRLELLRSIENYLAEVNRLAIHETDVPE
jgi:hypothetical protein